MASKVLRFLFALALPRFVIGFAGWSWLVIILSWAIPSMHGKRFLRNLGPAPRKYQRFTIREGLPPALHQAGKQLIANVTFPTGPGYLNVITGMV